MSCDKCRGPFPNHFYNCPELTKAKRVTMFQVPERNSEWLYNGKRIVVDMTYVKWHYKNPDDANSHVNSYSADIRAWGTGFKPAPFEPVPGVTYRHIEERGTRFHVYEVSHGKVFGREQAYVNGQWYAYSYTLEGFSDCYDGEIVDA